MDKTKILVVNFDNNLNSSELPQFRGAIVSTMNDVDILFHNHTEDDGFRYNYPLIQYKRIGGKAAIVCIGEGTEAIGEFFSSCNFDVQIGERAETLSVSAVNPAQCLIQVWDDTFEYTLRKWLPLNQKNYTLYKQADSLAEKYAMLEKLLIGNILSMAKGLGIHLEKNVVVKIKNVEHLQLYRHKGVKKMGLDVLFSTNVSLPNYIGLGQGVSMGFGMICGRRGGK